MPTMPVYGGGANPPVRLDPWQNIVNVHWSSRRIAARLDVLLAVTRGQELSDVPGGPAFVEPYSNAFVTDVTFSWPDSGSLTGFNRGSGGTWTPFPGDGITEGGAPLLPEYSFSPWQWQGINGFGLHAPGMRFAVGDEGADLEQTVPGHPSQHFTNGMTGNLVLRMQGFVSGGPYNSPFGGPPFAPKWATANSTGITTPIMNDAETGSISVSDMTLEIDGKTYAAVGSKVIAAVGDFDTGEFWVLFEKQIEEEPPP